jgi:hypothetical protein
LITNNHVVKDATKVRLLTGAGLIDAKVVQVDAANDLALLKADGRFAPQPIAASRTVTLGSTVAMVGFPTSDLTQRRKAAKTQGKRCLFEKGRSQVFSNLNSSSVERICLPVAQSADLFLL